MKTAVVVGVMATRYITLFCVKSLPCVLMLWFLLILAHARSVMMTHALTGQLLVLCVVMAPGRQQVGPPEPPPPHRLDLFLLPIETEIFPGRLIPCYTRITPLAVCSPACILSWRFESYY